MNNPMLSIIIPTYNAENTITRCIESILNQSYKDYEILIIDDGSEDGTAAVCAQFEQSDNRIQLFTQENQGVSAARNCGIQNAKGSYLMFVDGDDAILPDHLEAYVNKAESGGYDLVIGGLIKEYTEDNGMQIVLRPEASPGDYCVDDFWNMVCLKPELFGYLVNKIFRTEIIKTNGLFLNTNMSSQEDLDFCLSYYKYCDKVAIIPDAGYLYYYQEGKREPQIHHYIQNQLKLIQTAEARAELTVETRKAVKDRIILWVFSMCFQAENEKELYDQLSALNQINGLYSFLKSIVVTDEKAMIAKWYCQRRYKKIYKYFKCRKQMKKVVYIFKRH